MNARSLGRYLCRKTLNLQTLAYRQAELFAWYHGTRLNMLRTKMSLSNICPSLPINLDISNPRKFWFFICKNFKISR